MRRRTFLALACGLPLAGCQRPALQAEAFASLDGAPYTLASGDRLRIIVFGQDNLSNIYAVDGTGRIAMPLIGAVAVAGRTTAQAAGLIAARLRDGFIREPKVTVEVDAYRPFFILGEVTSSGQFAYVNGMTVQTAVAIAGGYAPRAAKDHAEITRHGPEGPVTAAVPITTPVRPGDTIVIKERWF